MIGIAQRRGVLQIDRVHRCGRSLSCRLSLQRRRIIRGCGFQWFHIVHDCGLGCGQMIPSDNTNANLLKPDQDTDWLHMDPWRVLRIQSEFVDGFSRLAVVLSEGIIWPRRITGPR